MLGAELLEENVSSANGNGYGREKMGLKIMLAVRGAVGGTARWAAKGYKTIVMRNPNASLNEIMQELVHIRYHTVSNKTVETKLISWINDDLINGLQHLVIRILSMEANFSENTTEDQSLFMDIIEEELEANGVSSDLVYVRSWRAASKE